MEPGLFVIEPARLRGWCETILEAVGMPSSGASVAAESLVRAEMRGQGSHGVMRLGTYVKRILAGLIDPRALPTRVRDCGALLVFDGGAGLGHVVGRHAMEACVERASETGLALAVVRNSSHFGIAGFFALQAAASGMIGMAMSNGPALMAPVGGKAPVLGTNPLAVAVPLRGQPPLLLDMATSAAALGKILQAQERGDAIPSTWALDSQGNPTTDPTEAAAARILQPLAGPKGFGLALVVEVLTAVLSGASFGRRAGSMYKSWDRPEDLGHAFAALNVGLLMPIEKYLDRMTDLAHQVRSSERSDARQQILLPGEPEARAEEQAAVDGILLQASQIRELRDLAAEVGAVLSE